MFYFVREEMMEDEAPHPGPLPNVGLATLAPTEQRGEGATLPAFRPLQHS